MRDQLRSAAAGLAVLALGLPAMAAAGAQADTATIRIFSRGGELRISGLNGGKSTTRLCAASTSGRYRLTITSRSGSMIGPGQLPYEIRFRDGSGAEQSATVGGAPMVQFDGVSPGVVACTSGPNAEIEILLSKAAILTGVAGEYFDQLDLSIAPL